MAPPSGPRTAPLCLWAVILGAILLAPHLRPIALLLLPGLLIHVIPGITIKGPISALTKTIASSVSFWIVAVWGASWVGLALSTLFWVVCPVSALLWLTLVARRTISPAIFPRTPVQIAALASAFALTISPFFLTVAPPGADMSMHGYITRMVYEAGGVPDTYQPYLPIEDFGPFSIGFHTIAALVISVSGRVLPMYRAVLLVDCLVFFLLFLFVWGMMSDRFHGRNVAAFSAALALFLSRNPQHFFAWGGTPTVLSIALIACAMPALRRPKDLSLGEAFFAALCLSSAFLTHPMPALILAAIYVPYAAYLVFAATRQAVLSKLLLRLLVIALICLTFISFFLVRFENRLSDDEQEWMQVWGSITSERWHGTVLDAPFTLTRHLAQYALGPLALPLAFALLLAIWSRDMYHRMDLYFVLAIVGIIINARYQLLPHSVFILPDRAAAMLPVFAAPLIGALLSKAQDAVAAVIPQDHVRQLGIVLGVALACACASGSYAYYIRPGLAEAPVTPDDLRAFDWIDKNTRPDAHIANNYSDAGLWIPTMTRRSVAVPHVNIINWSETKLALASRPAQFIYIGARSVYPFPFEWTPTGVEALRPTPRLVFQSGEARLYELDPSLARAISTNFERLLAGKARVVGEIELLRPAQAETLATPRVVLEWDPSGCDLFNVQLSLSPNFDNPLPIYNSYPAVQIASGSYDITPLRPLMPPNTPVYWRVRGLSAAGSDLFESAIRYFLRE